jgi:hypothetical protein
MTVEALQEIFFKVNRKHWILCAGRSRANRKAVSVTQAETSIEDSWGELSNMIDLQPEGEYTVFLQTSENAGNGAINYTLTKGTAVQPAAIGGVQGANVNAIGGIGMVIDYQNKITDHKLEILKKDFEIENLKRDAAQIKGADLIGKVTGIVEKHLPSILGYLSPNAHIGTLSHDLPVDAPIVKESKPKSTPTDFTDEEQKDLIQRTANCLDRLGRMFPEQLPTKTMDKKPTYLSMIKEFLCSK